MDIKSTINEKLIQTLVSINTYSAAKEKKADKIELYIMTPFGLAAGAGLLCFLFFCVKGIAGLFINLNEPSPAHFFGSIISMFLCVIAGFSGSLISDCMNNKTSREIHKQLEAEQIQLVKILEEIVDQLSPEQCTFEEAFAIVTNILNAFSETPLLKNIMTAACEEDNTEHELYPLACALRLLTGSLFQWTEVSSYSLMLRASTKQIRDIAPRIFQLQTGKYLDEMSCHLQLGGVVESSPTDDGTIYLVPKYFYRSLDDIEEGETQPDNILFVMLFNQLRKKYIASSEEQVEQCMYNMAHLYPILKARKEAKLQDNFEKTMAASRLPLWTPEEQEAMRTATQTIAV